MVNQITYISALFGALPFLLLLPIFAFHAWNRVLPGILVAAVVVSLCWHLLIATSGQAVTLANWMLQIAEVLRYGIWITVLVVFLEDSTGRKISSTAKLGIVGACVGSLCLFLSIPIFGEPESFDPRFAIYNNLMLSILGVFVSEQLFRNAAELRLPKLVSVILGALFAYDAFLLTNMLVFSSVSIELWQARTLASGISALFLLAGVFAQAGYRPRTSKFTLSRPIAFSTTSVMLAGVFLLFMSLTGYYVSLTGGHWGAVLQAVILFVALLVIALVFASRTMRARLYVQINKHFFQHKYDYRNEWRKLNNELSTPVEGDEYLEVALSAASGIFDSKGGAIYLEEAGVFRPALISRMEMPADASISVDSAFCRLMEEQKWIWLPGHQGPEELDKYNSIIPDNIAGIDDLFLILPLVTNEELLGFVLLSHPERPSVAEDAQVSWEDLDLMRMVSHEIANYVSSRRAIEQLVEAQLFDVYNRLSAFVMHDLKNLIAQQALVVKNAGIHKDNPEFILDAIGTIDSSVTRMSKLLNKLQSKTVESGERILIKNVRVQDAIEEAVKQCHGVLPVPEPSIEDRGLVVRADWDNLVMIFIHMIKNAQEASREDGSVTIKVEKKADAALIEIADCGKGMDESFVRQELFKPFRSTKDGKGMGIGAHQCKFLIESMGGGLDVESSVGLGTTMKISLPCTSS